MRSHRCVGAVLPAMLALSCMSCGDNGTSNSNSFTIEYRITPSSPYFTEITYTGPSGQPVTVNDLSSFAGGSRQITVSTRPFDAKLSAVMVNSSVATVDFVLAILVDGRLQATTPGAAPAASSSYVTSVEHVIQ